METKMLLYEISLLIISNVLAITADELPEDPAEIQNFNLTLMEDYFKLFVKHFHHVFKAKEKEDYYRTFKENVLMLDELNTAHPLAKFRINEFTHLDLDQFTDWYTGFNDTGSDDAGVTEFLLKEAHVSDISYVYYNLLFTSSYPKHQGHCKTSYVFSAIANIEAQLLKEFSAYSELSIMQGYSCEKRGSCKYGGLPHLVIESLIKADGLMDSEILPYVPPSLDDTKVHMCPAMNKSDVKFKVTGVTRLKVQDELELMSALYFHGPLVTAIYVSESVKNYHSGILDPVDCAGNKPNHAVLLLGYGEEADSSPYWILRNSWGREWGQFGIMKLIRDKRACGIGSYLVTAEVDMIDKTNASTRPPFIIPHGLLQTTQLTEKSLGPLGDIDTDITISESISSEESMDDTTPLPNDTALLVKEEGAKQNITIDDRNLDKYQKLQLTTKVFTAKVTETRNSTKSHNFNPVPNNNTTPKMFQKFENIMNSVSDLLKNMTNLNDSQSFLHGYVPPFLNLSNYDEELKKLDTYTDLEDWFAAKKHLYNIN